MGEKSSIKTTEQGIKAKDKLVKNYNDEKKSKIENYKQSLSKDIENLLIQDKLDINWGNRILVMCQNILKFLESLDSLNLNLNLAKEFKKINNLKIIIRLLNNGLIDEEPVNLVNEELTKKAKILLNEINFFLILLELKAKPEIIK